jgi:UDP-N-acetylglucosamine 2-epimerase (non-hydrolysing)
MKKLLFVLGTRPEAIKLAPLVRLCDEYRDKYETRVCVTAQHREMLDDVLSFFDIKPDYDLNLMQPNQSLFDITIEALRGLKQVFEEYKPDNIFIEGDTTTVLVGALTGFYTKTKVSHVEAGLRSGDKFSPYPEEMNRVLAGHLSDYHFAPTPRAAENLANEGIRENVWVVGNTVIDALFLGLKTIESAGDRHHLEFFDFIDFSKRVILVTCHRRESFGRPFENICFALRDLSERFKDIEIIYPVHLNPNVLLPAREILGEVPSIHLIDPLSYSMLIWIMNRSHLVLTDSGGIQEEAPSLGKPVLVMRDVTERTEGIDAGTAKLVGTDRERIVREASTLLTDAEAYEEMSKAVNPYGDGKASGRIMDIISSVLGD